VRTPLKLSRISVLLLTMVISADRFARAAVAARSDRGRHVAAEDLL
jgi:hypothetical protein